MRVRVPGSSANLGPAFDALGMALTLYLEVGPEGDPLPDGHPALVAFRQAGGRGGLGLTSDIPPARGLGYSGAARVAGALAAGLDRAAALALAITLEGHADNAAPSLIGGVVAVGGGRAVRVPMGLGPVAVVVWVPADATSTDESRAALDRPVAFADAVFNIGQTALLVAAIASGDHASLGSATEDRLHQDRRLATLPASRAAIDAARAGGAWGAWLSGSGPAVAAFCSADAGADLAASLPPGGESLVLAIDTEGAVVLD